MLEAYLEALKAAINAIDRPYNEIGHGCNISKVTLYKITGTTKMRKPQRKNAKSMTEYLEDELEGKLRHHVKEAKRIKQILGDLRKTYDALYPAKPAKRTGEDLEE